jgi:signal peptidase
MKVLSWFVSIVLGVVVAGLAFIYFSPGYNMYVVRSDSMKPVFAAGDLIIAKPSSSEIKVGSIITFQKGAELVTHRVIELTENGVITKGDANEDADTGTVALSQVKGSYFMKLPYVGYVSAFVQTRTGWLLAVLIPAVLLLGWIITDILREALKPQGAVAAQVERVERREKIARGDNVILSENVALRERFAWSTQILNFKKADRSYYKAFKPQRMRKDPCFYIQ